MATTWDRSISNLHHQHGTRSVSLQCPWYDGPESLHTSLNILLHQLKLSYISILHNNRRYITSDTQHVQYLFQGMHVEPIWNFRGSTACVRRLADCTSSFTSKPTFPIDRLNGEKHLPCSMAALTSTSSAVTQGRFCYINGATSRRRRSMRSIFRSRKMILPPDPVITKRRHFHPRPLSGIFHYVKLFCLTPS